MVMFEFLIRREDGGQPRGPSCGVPLARSAKHLQNRAIRPLGKAITSEREWKGVARYLLTPVRAHISLKSADLKFRPWSVWIWRG